MSQDAQHEHYDHDPSKQLVKMANDIGNFFRSEPDREEAIAGIAKHISSFWTGACAARLPRMARRAWMSCRARPCAAWPPRPLLPRHRRPGAMPARTSRLGPVSNLRSHDQTCSLQSAARGSDAGGSGTPSGRHPHGLEPPLAAERAGHGQTGQPRHRPTVCGTQACQGRQPAASGCGTRRPGLA